MIYIIRHGQTDLNKQGVLLGRTDVPLNAEGHREALQAAKQLSDRGVSFDVCYSSPLQRAVQTAEIVSDFQKSEITIDDLLLEMDYGPYEGTPLKDPPEEIRTFFQDFVHNQAPAGMEQLSHVVSRMGEFLEKLPYHEDENILISTHAIAMKGALEYLTPGSNGGYWGKYIGNCTVYRFDKIGEKFTMPEVFQ